MFWLCLSILAITSVHATIIDKPLINISNCFNVTVNADLTSGNTSYIAFSGCSFLGNDSWFCNCFSSDNHNYTLIMQTDNTILRDSRDYRITLDARLYAFEKDRLRFKVNDWGDYIDLGDVVNDSFGDTREKVEVPIYVDRVVYQDKIVDHNIYVDKIVYVENTSKIDSCLIDLNKSNESINIQIRENRLLIENNKYLKVIQFWLIVALSVACLVVLLIQIFNNQRKK